MATLVELAHTTVAHIAARRLFESTLLRLRVLDWRMQSTGRRDLRQPDRRLSALPRTFTHRWVVRLGGGGGVMAELNALEHGAERVQAVLLELLVLLFAAVAVLALAQALGDQNAEVARRVASAARHAAAAAAARRALLRWRLQLLTRFQQQIQVDFLVVVPQSVLRNLS